MWVCVHCNYNVGSFSLCSTPYVALYALLGFDASIDFSWQALYTYADRLQEVKADKEQVAMEMDVVLLPTFCCCTILPRLSIAVAWVHSNSQSLPFLIR